MGVLSDLSLRFTQAKDFNDPFEIFPNIEAFIPPEQLHGYLAQFEGTARASYERAMVNALAKFGLPSAISGLLSYDVVRVLGFDVLGHMEQLLPSAMEAHREQFGADIQRSVGDKIGILSLSENATSLLMWAHYASSHEGFLLQFDASNGFFNQRRKDPGEIFGRLLPVTYATDRPTITVYDPSADSEAWARKLVGDVFLTKSTDWSYEKEWRMFLPLDDPEFRPHRVIDGRLHLFDFPPDALTAVVVGARATQSTRAQIEERIRESSSLRHVHLLQAKISVHRFEVMIEPYAS